MLGQAQALVGPSENGQRFAAHVVMVLAQTGGRASFCSGVVLTPRTILTAAHCVADRDGTRVYVPSDQTHPTLLALSKIAIHPGFRAQAITARVKSIDLALVELAAALPSSFMASPLADEFEPREGAEVHVAGFGLSHEQEPKSGGVLRTSTLQIAPPLSQILIWTRGRPGQAQGACTGDSGAPIWDASESSVIALVAWASGTAGHACGDLTQGVLIAPQRAWITSVLQRWGGTTP